MGSLVSTSTVRVPLKCNNLDLTLLSMDTSPGLFYGSGTDFMEDLIINTDTNEYKIILIHSGVGSMRVKTGSH